MVKDLTVILQDRPGALAEMGEILGNAGINIEGICGISKYGGGEVHILVEDPATARQALEAKGLEVKSERDILIIDIIDKPGTLGEVARKLAKAGVNIEMVYLTSRMKLVIGVDYLEKARSALRL